MRAGRSPTPASATTFPQPSGHPSSTRFAPWQRAPKSDPARRAARHPVVSRPAAPRRARHPRGPVREPHADTRPAVDPIHPSRTCEARAARLDPACPEETIWAVGQAPGGRSEGAGRRPRAWRAGIGLGEAGGAVPRRWACSPRSKTNFEAARSSSWHDQNPANRFREPRAHQSSGKPGEARGFAAGAGKSGSHPDDLARPGRR